MAFLSYFRHLQSASRQKLKVKCRIKIDILNILSYQTESQETQKAKRLRKSRDSESRETQINNEISAVLSDKIAEKLVD